MKNALEIFKVKNASAADYIKAFRKNFEISQDD